MSPSVSLESARTDIELRKGAHATVGNLIFSNGQANYDIGFSDEKLATVVRKFEQSRHEGGCWIAYSHDGQDRLVWLSTGQFIEAAFDQPDPMLLDEVNVSSPR